MIERCDNSNAKGCPYELLSGNFHYQPVPPGQYDLLNDNDYDDNNNSGTPADGVFPEKKGWNIHSFQMHLMLIIMMKTMDMIYNMMVLVVTPRPLTPSKTKL